MSSPFQVPLQWSLVQQRWVLFGRLGKSQWDTLREPLPEVWPDKVALVVDDTTACKASRKLANAKPTVALAVTIFGALSKDSINCMAAMAPRWVTFRAGARDANQEVLQSLRNVAGLGLTDVTLLASAPASITGLVMAAEAPLTNIERFKELRTLQIIGQPVSFEAIEHIAALPQLHTLSLVDVPLDTVDIQKLSQNSAIIVFDLSGSALTDAGLKHVGSMVNLRRLYLRGTAITAQGLSTLGGLTKLEKLDLSGCNIKASQPVVLPELLAKLSNLRELDISLTEAPLADFIPLPPSVEVLGLAGRKSSAEKLNELLVASNVSIVNLFAMKAPFELEKKVANQLTHVILDGSGVGASTVEKIAANPDLVMLDATGVPVNKQSIAALGNNKTLQWLDLRGTDVGAQAVTQLRTASGLRWLGLPKQIPPATIESLRAALPNIEIVKQN